MRACLLAGVLAAILFLFIFGGSPSEQCTKERVIQVTHTSVYPPCPLQTNDYSPNFKGAAEAAERLALIPEFVNARVVKSNPDTPQHMVRGICVYQA